MASALGPAPRQQAVEQARHLCSAHPLSLLPPAVCSAPAAAQQQGLGSRLPLAPLPRAQGLVLLRRLEGCLARLRQAAAVQPAAVFLAPSLAVPHHLGSRRVVPAARRHLGLPLGRRPHQLVRLFRQRPLRQRQGLDNPQGLDSPRVSASLLASGSPLLLGSRQALVRVRHPPLGNLHGPLVGRQRLQRQRRHLASRPRQHQALASQAPSVVGQLLLVGAAALAHLPHSPRQQGGLALLRLLVEVGVPLVRLRHLAALQHLGVAPLGLARLAAASHNNSSSNKGRAACGRCEADCARLTCNYAITGAIRLCAHACWLRATWVLFRPRVVVVKSVLSARLCLLRGSDGAE